MRVFIYLKGIINESCVLHSDYHLAYSNWFNACYDRVYSIMDLKKVVTFAEITVIYVR